jgi:hypothetical protein
MYMLVKNENSFINILAQGAPGWFPEYEISLGDQSQVPADITSLRVAGSGSASLFKRDYQNGIVLCNTSGSAMNYALSGNTWNVVNTSGGGSVTNSGTTAQQSITFTPVSSQVSVPAFGCVILTNNVAAVHGRTQKPDHETGPFLNPGNGVIAIDQAGAAFVYNLKGEMQIQKTSTANRTQIDVSKLSCGVYLVTFISATGRGRMVSERFTYWK